MSKKNIVFITEKKTSARLLNMADLWELKYDAMIWDLDLDFDVLNMYDENRDENMDGFRYAGCDWWRSYRAHLWCVHLRLMVFLSCSSVMCSSAIDGVLIVRICDVFICDWRRSYRAYLSCVHLRLTAFLSCLSVVCSSAIDGVLIMLICQVLICDWRRSDCTHLWCAYLWLRYSYRAFWLSFLDLIFWKFYI